MLDPFLSAIYGTEKTLEKLASFRVSFTKSAQLNPVLLNDIARSPQNYGGGAQGGGIIGGQLTRVLNSILGGGVASSIVGGLLSSASTHQLRPGYTPIFRPAMGTSETFLRAIQDLRMGAGQPPLDLSP